MAARGDARVTAVLDAAPSTPAAAAAAAPAAAARRRPVKRAKPPPLPLEPPNLPWRFTLVGPPRTKNTGKAPQPGRVIPSAAYRRWFHAAMAQLPIVRATCRGTCTEPVDVTAIFYRERNVGDEDRYCVALGDWLQRSGLILNDSLIHWTGETRREIDRERPRVEIMVGRAQSAR